VVYNAAMLRNELGWFDQEENNSSQVVARLTSDAMVVRSAVSDRLSLIVQNGTLLLVSVSIGFVLSWKLTAVMLALFPLIFASIYVEVREPVICLYLSLHTAFEKALNTSDTKTRALGTSKSG
jgi:ABC-type multidrug transport system fused ATPase/permease subunit